MMGLMVDTVPEDLPRRERTPERIGQEFHLRWKVINLLSQELEIQGLAVPSGWMVEERGINLAQAFARQDAQNMAARAGVREEDLKANTQQVLNRWEKKYKIQIEKDHKGSFMAWLLNSRTSPMEAKEARRFMAFYLGAWRGASTWPWTPTSEDTAKDLAAERKFEIHKKLLSGLGDKPPADIAASVAPQS